VTEVDLKAMPSQPSIDHRGVARSRSMWHGWPANVNDCAVGPTMHESQCFSGAVFFACGRESLIACKAMRALAFLANIGIIAAAYYFGSWTGMFIALAVCVVLVVGFLVFSTDKTEAEESRKTRKAMGRNTTFLAGLFGPSDR
jgi:uncharacterized membrane protein YfcA